MIAAALPPASCRRSARAPLFAARVPAAALAAPRTSFGLTVKDEEIHARHHFKTRRWARLITRAKRWALIHYTYGMQSCPAAWGGRTFRERTRSHSGSRGRARTISNDTTRRSSPTEELIGPGEVPALDRTPPARTAPAHVPILPGHVGAAVSATRRSCCRAAAVQDWGNGRLSRATGARHLSRTTGQ